MSEQPPWLVESSEEEDDDWFYDSIRRYDQLCMFRLPLHPKQLAVSPCGTKLAVSGTSGSAHEIHVYSIPEKLTTECPVKEGLSNKRDFSLIAGTKQDVATNKMYFRDDEVLVVHEEDKVKLWKISSESDCLDLTLTIDLPANFACLKAFFLDSDRAFLASPNTIIPYDLKALRHQDPIVFDTNKLGDILDMASFNTAPIVLCSKGYIETLDLHTLHRIQELNMKATHGHFVRSEREDTIKVFLNNDHAHVICQWAVEGAMETKVLKANEGGADRAMKVAGDVLVRHVAPKELDVERFTQSKSQRIFTHDGHKAEILDFQIHPTIHTLVFSIDKRQSLHAWRFPMTEKKAVTM